MRILVTGGAGMVGSHAAEYFAKKKYKIIALDNLMRSKLFGYNKKSVEYNWHYLSRYKNIERIKQDIRDEKVLNKIFDKGIDAIIHTAGQPGVIYSIDNPINDFSINAYGTFNVLEAARKFCKKGCIFIYCSTNKVYGENVCNIPILEKKKRYVFKNTKGINEKMPIDLTAHTPYGVSKYIGDIYTQEYSHMYNMRTCVFRMSCTYGTRQFGFEDQGWLAHFLISHMRGKSITIYGNGKQVRDVLYVEDLIRAFDLFMNSNLKSEVFNIGGGEDNNISLSEYIEKIEAETGKKTKMFFKKWRPSDQKVYISDISKIKRILHWSPKIDIDEGIIRLLNWFNKNIKYFK